MIRLQQRGRHREEPRQRRRGDPDGRRARPAAPGLLRRSAPRNDGDETGSPEILDVR
jgi:hypothetical protein